MNELGYIDTSVKTKVGPFDKKTMPKKKKTHLSENKQATQVRVHEDLEANEKDDIPDAETVRKMKEKLINEKPELRQVFQYMDKMSEDRLKHAQDSSFVLKNERGFVTPELLLQYPNSPTAKYTMKH
ncbi:uncharacterized protein LOC132758867 [Ruditapes philippinarum]|uniref:uncharacterized protein LOC132758867 n=1 Tax=Ruditapes philippinarum TaxID=129788 RepID=UPI00295B5BC7|nr:uncharacterized protein LOC132758867 [Ruditapes philippinarum]